MKKLAILFLLTTVLVAFSFAQVSITGDYSLFNVTSADGVGIEPTVGLKFAGSGSKDLGPGAINLSGELQYKIYYGGLGLQGLGTPLATAGSSAYDIGDNNFRLGYALEAGPGTLNFGFKWADLLTTRELDVGYDDITLGPATLGFGAWYALKTSGVGPTDPSNLGDNGGDSDLLGFRIGVGFDFGLNFTYKFEYATQVKKVHKIAYLDINFTGIENLTIGVELDNTGETSSPYGSYFDGFLVKPYLGYAIQEDISVGAYCKFDNIIGSNGDMIVTPGVTVSYTF